MVVPKLFRLFGTEESETGPSKHRRREPYLLELFLLPLLLLLVKPVPNVLRRAVPLRMPHGRLALPELRLARCLQDAPCERLLALGRGEVEVGIQRAGQKLRVHQPVEERIVLRVRSVRGAAWGARLHAAAADQGMRSSQIVVSVV